MRSSQLTAAIGVIVLSLTACGFDDSIVGPRDFEQLAAAESRWNARTFQNYSYEIRVMCFCPAEVTRWTRVTVRDGGVTNAEAVEPDPNFPITNINYWEPIDSLFVDIRRTMNDPTSSTYLEAIVVTYDPVLGYPLTIEYRAKRNVLDGGSTFSLRNVTPLN